MRVIDGLHAEAIAREQQCPGLAVPQGERPHAIEASEAGLAPLGIGGQHDFRVGLGVERVAQCGEFSSQLDEIIDLAVERDPVPVGRERGLLAAVGPEGRDFPPPARTKGDGLRLLVRHGTTTAAAQIQDGQAPVTQSQPSVEQQAASVRPAMRERIGETPEFAAIDGMLKLKQSGNAAHD